MFEFEMVLIVLFDFKGEAAYFAFQLILDDVR